jgi:CheY-like chemotaxis protein
MPGTVQNDTVIDKQTILIVEDQRDLARMLQSGLKATSPGTMVINVPSAEEALLVASNQRFDLLIIDVLLPGMSGFVLMDRLKKRQPEARTILITGSADNEVRRKVANSGAEAFFFKPVEVSAILDAVARCLALDRPPPLPALEPEPDTPRETLDGQITRLRRELAAITVLLLDDRGRPLIQAGDLPPAMDPKIIYPALMGAFSAAARVSNVLGMRLPEDIQVFSSGNHELYLAHAGESVALVAVIEKTVPGGVADTVLPLLRHSTADMLPLLAEIGLPSGWVEEGPAPDTQEEPVEDDPAAVEELEGLLDEAAEMTFSEDEIAAFWDSAGKNMDTGSLNPDDLSYDQARKIGLAPEEED